jgi:hypothetical protein
MASLCALVRVLFDQANQGVLSNRANCSNAESALTGFSAGSEATRVVLNLIPKKHM